MTKAYPNDLTWEQSELIAELFPEARIRWSSSYHGNVHFMRCDYLRTMPLDVHGVHCLEIFPLGLQSMVISGHGVKMALG